MVIAIDGPAASGKSSTARAVADRLGYHHLDSGALYRAATFSRLNAPGDPPWTEDSVVQAAQRVSLEQTRIGNFGPRYGGAFLDIELRGSDVTLNVSAVARMPRIRVWVNELVRVASKEDSVVVDGRDIGTAVFPNADLKIFLVADPRERARRRLLQDLRREPTAEEVAAETERLVQRDAKDATQSAPAADAVLIDTTTITVAEQVDRIVALARAVTQRPGATSRY